MKKINSYFLTCLLFSSIHVNLIAQGLSTFFEPLPSGTTQITVSPGDNINFYAHNDGLPPHCCSGISGIIYIMGVEYEVFLINSISGIQYSIGTFFFGTEGANCSSTGEVYEFGDVTQNIPVPDCILPDGNYWLAIKLINSESISGGCIELGGVLSAINLVSGLGETITAGGIIYNVLEVDIINSNTFTDVGLTKVNKTCLSDGSLTATPIDGTTPYSYLWNTGNTTNMIDNLDDGNYSVTVTDANGCQVTVSDVITEPYIINLMESVQEPCTFDEGFIELNPSGGVAPYSYNWNTGETTSSINQLFPGTYQVIVTDNDGCQVEQTFSLNTIYQASDFDYPWGLIISSPNQSLADIDNDGKITIRGRMIVEEGINYSINNITIEFADNIEEILSPDLGLPRSGIIIEKKSKLTLNGVTLRGVSGCADMWDGVQVWGDQPITISPSTLEVKLLLTPQSERYLKNGKLIMNNAQIQDAHAGVSLYRPTIPFALPPPVEYGRGILEATNSRFINNRVSVAFRGYSLINNYSFIKGCTFTNDAAMKDANKYNGEGMLNFISLTRVKQVKITASEFNGHLTFGEENRGTAIFSYDASYIVESGQVGIVPVGTLPTPNEFNNTTKGIDAFSTGGLNKNIKVKDNRFNNVQQGIIANGTSFDEISLNEFEIPEGTAALNTFGVFLYGTYGFLTTENIFNTTATSPYTYGVLARNTYLTGGEIYHNNFTGNFESATQMEQNNSNLELKCNEYTNTNTYDWAVTSGTLANQGDCDAVDETAPAGNRFDECLTADESQIFVDASASGFVYSSQSGIMPICISTSVLPNDCFVLFDESAACPVIIDVPCGTPCILTRKSEFDNEPPGFTKELMKAGLFRAMQNNDDIAGLLEILATNETNSDLRMLIATYLSYGHCEQAKETLERLSGTSIPDAQFKQLFTVLITACEEGRTEKELTPGEKQTIGEIALVNEQFAVHAEAVQTRSDEKIFIREAERINTNKSMFTNNSSEAVNDETANDMASLKVYPNPVNETASIEFYVSPEESATQIIIYDLSGKAVKEINVSGNKGIVNINPQELQQGTYFCVLLSSQQIVAKTLISVIH